MGYYIETPAAYGKARWIADNYSGEILSFAPASWADIPEGKALIGVVENSLFEAAAFAYDEGEFRQFTGPAETRPVTYVLMDRTEAELASGYYRPQGSFPDYNVRDPKVVRNVAVQIKRDALPGETAKETMERVNAEAKARENEQRPDDPTMSKLAEFADREPEVTRSRLSRLLRRH